jgi:hypothetical protein
MASRRLLFGALGVAAILIIASTIYILENPPEPQPSVAVQMALLPGEVGANWYGEIQDNPTYPVAGNYFDNATSHAKDTLWNGTAQYGDPSYGVTIYLTCWNNSSCANHSFENSLGTWGGYNATSVNITVGDRTYLYYNSYNQIYMGFLKGNIECLLFADGSFYGQPWWIDSTIWIAQLQLDKIDQHLAQHPGAS